METKLKRIAEKSRKEPSFKLTSLFHLMNEELLWECFWRLKGKDAVHLRGDGRRQFHATRTRRIGHAEPERGAG
ncbi:MAG: hypothetical protein ABFS39_10960 [Pseudomonadota bacterium]